MHKTCTTGGNPPALILKEAARACSLLWLTPSCAGPASKRLTSSGPPKHLGGQRCCNEAALRRFCGSIFSWPETRGCLPSVPCCGRPISSNYETSAYSERCRSAFRGDGGHYSDGMPITFRRLSNGDRHHRNPHLERSATLTGYPTATQSTSACHRRSVDCGL